MNTGSPVESKTRTHNGRVGSAQRTADGGAGRSWAEQGADISVGPEGNRPFSPPGYRKQLFGMSLRKHEQRKSYVNRWRNKTRGSPAVDQRLTTAISIMRISDIRNQGLDLKKKYVILYFLTLCVLRFLREGLDLKI